MKIFLCIILALCVAANAFYIHDYPSPLESPKYRPIMEKILGKALENSSGKTGRITGGQIATRHQFPYQVYLLLSSVFGTFLCGGSIVTPNHVLTAAHCIDQMNSAEIFFGANNKINRDHLQVIRVARSNMKMHENYDANTIANDVGIVSFTGLILLPGQIEIINLIPSNLANDHFISRTARASGWGIERDNGGTSEKLRFVDLVVRDLQHCRDIFGPVVVRDSNVCTNANAGTGKSTCGGDSGGPLVLDYGSSRFQIGVVSYGAAAGCELGFPSVFARVGSFLPWIERNTK